MSFWKRDTTDTNPRARETLNVAIRLHRKDAFSLGVLQTALTTWWNAKGKSVRSHSVCPKNLPHFQSLVDGVEAQHESGIYLNGGKSYE